MANLLNSIDKIASPFARRVYIEKNRFIREYADFYIKNNFQENEFIFSEHKKNIAKIFGFYYKKAIIAGGESVNIETKNMILRLDKKDLSPENMSGYWVDLVKSYLSVYGAAKISRVSKTTRDDIRAALVGSALDGRDKVKKAILKTRALSRVRATVIAQTETHGAAMHSSFESAKKLGRDFGVKTQKEWITTEDSRTRDIHSETNGQVVDMEQPFIVGGEEMERPGDPSASAENVINCRCVLGYVAN